MLNQFEGKSKKELEIIKIGLKSYKQGTIDFWGILDDIYKNSINHYNKLIDECEKLIKESKC